MTIINVLVEGQTEERFIKEIFCPYMNDFNIHLIPTVINTKLVNDGKNFKGGLSNLSFDKFLSDLHRLLSSTPHGYVSTFIDYYALPSKFPGYNERNSYITPIEKVQFLEYQLFCQINHDNFIPYIQLHEFETLLFTEKDGFINNIDSSEGNVERLVKIIDEFENPEDINHGLSTAPSKRILQHFPSYNKLIDANSMLKDIGVENLLNKCPHFKTWFDKLIFVSNI